MERSIYFDGWTKNVHCYHPSLPMRHIGMVDDLEKYKATMLVWAAMGGGSISLPYLEQEAFGDVPPRLRFYGYMNDAEFIRECKKRGIKVYGIVFEVQGWEFPILLDGNTNSLRAFNMVEGEGDGTPNSGIPIGDGTEVADWYGLREFSSGKHDHLFPTTLKDYYPNGIINSDGEAVTDLWEETAARTYRGAAVHAGWVECPDNAHQAYQTCRNNPVWRDYLKQIIKLMIDAGVDGIQLDEAELPITSLKAGGCFCKDCRKQFRAFLQGEKAAGRLHAQWHSLDLDTFDYKQFVVDGGYDFPNDTPLFREYYEFQLRAIKKYFTELADYIRAYSREVGRDGGDIVQVSGNFFNCMPCYFPFSDTVDCVITEMESTLFRQPHWYRYINGFAGGKPVLVAENPYGGVIPELLEMLDAGKGYDLYRLMLAEAAVYGCNMSVPYGGWMGSVIKDAFYPPRALTEHFQTFLANHEKLFSSKSGAKTAIVYSWPSYYWREATKSNTGNVNRNPAEGMLFYHPTDLTDESTTRLPFWEILKDMADGGVVCDVVALGGDIPDAPFGTLCEDNLTAHTFDGYDLIIIPDCPAMTPAQVAELHKRADAGVKIILVGDTPGDNHANILRVATQSTKAQSLVAFNEIFRGLYADVATAQVLTHADRVGIHTHDGKNIWLLNYHYDAQADAITPIPALELRMKNAAKIKVHRLDKLNPYVVPEIIDVAADGHFTLPQAGLLTILEIIQ